MSMRMLFRSLFAEKFRTGAPRVGLGKKNRKARLTLESLEERITPAGDPLLEPPVIQSVGGLLTATLTQTVGPTQVGDFAVTNAWMYNNLYVGPTLLAKPGDLLDITIDNQLFAAGESGVTNLHTHGLHVSPVGDADNILLVLEPGESNHYQIQIPANHPEGLYWYHPHHHGTANEQLAMGLSGMLVIGEVDRTDPTIFRADGGASELNGIRQHLLALRNGQLSPAPSTTPPATEYTLVDPASPAVDQTFTVNGQAQPVITMRPNERRVFNVVNTGNNASYVLELFDQNGATVPNGLLAVAVDGIPFTTAQPVSSLGFPSGRRYSFVVQPTAAGTWSLQSTGLFDGRNTWPAVNLLTIEVTGNALPAPAPITTLTLPPGLEYFHDLSSITPAEIREMEFSQETVNGVFVAKVNGQPLPNNTIFQPRLNTVEQWNLSNVTNDIHPFHLHVNPQQVTAVSSFGGVVPGAGVINQLQDTYDVPAVSGGVTGTTTIRVEFSDFLGAHVYHCHRVDHEDDGMMGLINVIPEAPYYAIGANAGKAPVVKVFDPVTSTTQPVRQIQAFNSSFKGGVRAAVGDVNGDGVYDIIVGSGPGVRAQVKVFDGVTFGLIKSFAPFGNSKLGVFVASGYIDGDHNSDIIVGLDAGSTPAVKIFSGQDGALLKSFLAYTGGFRGGVRVAAADINGDGRIEVVTGPGPGGRPEVRVFNGMDATMLGSVRAYGNSFTGGVYVATGYTADTVTGFGFWDIVTGPGPGMEPLVKVFGIPTDTSHGTDDETMHTDTLDLELVRSFVSDPDGFNGGGVKVLTIQGAYGDTILAEAVPLAPAPAFVQSLYTDVLGRFGSNAEVAAWVGQLAQNDHSNVASAIALSPEARTRLVRSWYTGFLGRSAAHGEEQSWVKKLLGGATEEQVLSQFLGSTEYFKRAPLALGGTGTSTNQTFVQALYLQLFNRASSASEINFWANRVPTQGRAGVAASLLGSSEYRTITVRSYYAQLLGRNNPSSAEVNGWVRSGSDLGKIRISFLSSSEYVSSSEQ